MKVEILSYDFKTPEPEVLETWTLDASGRAVCDYPDSQRDAERSGLYDYDAERTVYPAEGRAFLRCFPDRYAHSSFVKARIVEE